MNSFTFSSGDEFTLDDHIVVRIVQIKRDMTVRFRAHATSDFSFRKGEHIDSKTQRDTNIRFVRGKNQSFVLNGCITIKVVKVTSNVVNLECDGYQGITIQRKEIPATAEELKVTQGTPLKGVISLIQSEEDQASMQMPFVEHPTGTVSTKPPDNSTIDTKRTQETRPEKKRGFFGRLFGSDS